MKRIKFFALGLILGLSGIVYAAASGNQSTQEACNMNKAEASCCNGGSCCTGGSCCGAKTAKQ